MKILITGGAGYIGSHTIIEILESTGWTPVSADNFINSYPDTFERIRKITGKTVVNHQVDLCDLNATRNIFVSEGYIDGVIHFAALKSVPESVANPELYYRNNNESLKNILACLKAFNVPSFIFSSSCSVYGNIRELPVNEESPIQEAQSPYGHTKQMGEEIIQSFSKENPGISSIALRYFNPVGAHPTGLIGERSKRKNNNLVPAITETAAGLMECVTVHGSDYETRDGSCIRDYVHVSDIASAHVLALKYLAEKKNHKNFEIINLGTGNGVSVFEAIKAFEKASGMKLNYKVGPRREGDVGAIYSDSTKATKELGWKPKYSIEEMMSSAWKWQLSQSSTQQ